MNVVFRCDSGLEIGTGHVLRCLALAHALREQNHRVDFVVASISDGLRLRLESKGFSIFGVGSPRGSLDDANELIRIASNRQANWIITDGYHFRTEYQRLIKKNDFKLMCIDDIADCEYVSDIILNQNPGFSSKDYIAADYSKFLLGQKYILLRPEFLNAKPIVKDFFDPSKRVLVTMGGADKDNLTAKTMEAVKTIENLEIMVLIGSANPHKDEISTCAEKFPVMPQIITDIENVVPYMLTTDIAIHAAGTTSWELAYLGIPSISYVLAENQLPVASKLKDSGFSIYMGWSHEFSAKELSFQVSELANNPGRLAKMSRSGQTLVDGLGIKRILREFS